MKKLKKLSVLALLAVGFALVFGGCSNADDETKTEQGGGGDGTDKGDDSDKKEEEKEEEKEAEEDEIEFKTWYGCTVNKNVIKFNGGKESGGAYYADKDLSGCSAVKLTVKGSYEVTPEQGMKFAVKILNVDDPNNPKYVDLGYPTIDEANKSQTFTYENVAEKLSSEDGAKVKKPCYLTLTNASTAEWGEKANFAEWSLTVEKIEIQ